MKQNDIIKGCSHCYGAGRNRPKLFGVRVEDDDMGTSAVVGVVAETEDAARELVESLTQRPVFDVYRT